MGQGRPCFLIAEVAQNHVGSVAMAHSFIDLAATCGVDAVKFQTHVARAESTRDEPFRVPIRGGYRSRFEYWEAMEFSPDEWKRLSEHARDNKLVFLSSPFSPEAAQLLGEVGVAAWKVGSGELFTEPLLRSLSSTGLPVILSTGMSTFAEVEGAVDIVRSGPAPLALLQCVSRYPAPLEEVGLNVMHDFAEKFDCPVGLSDHSGTIWPSLAAMAQGAAIVEVHMTFDRRIEVPDATVSLEPDELRLLAEARDAFWRMEQNAVDKDSVVSELAATREVFTKSIAPVRELQSGTVLQKDMFTLKKPGTGIPAAQMENLLGRRLARSVTPDRLLTWEDLDG